MWWLQWPLSARSLTMVLGRRLTYMALRLTTKTALSLREKVEKEYIDKKMMVYVRRPTTRYPVPTLAGGHGEHTATVASYVAVYATYHFTPKEAPSEVTAPARGRIES